MTVHLMGTTVVEFPGIDPGIDSGSFTNRRPDSAYEALRWVGSAGVAATGIFPVGETLSDFWLQFYLNAVQSAGIQFLVFRDAANNRDLFRLLTSGTGGDLILQYYNGSGWTALTTFNVPSSSSGVTKLDFHFKLHATDGEIEVFVDSVSVYSLSGVNTIYNTSTGINSFEIKMRTASTGSTLGTHVSGLICADEPTVSMRYLSKLMPSSSAGNGDLQEWTGNANSIRGGGTDEGSFITSDAFDQISTFAPGAYPTEFTDGREVLAIQVALHGRLPFDATGSSRPVLRSGSTNMFGAPTALEAAFKSVAPLKATVNDATGLPFTIAELNAIQGGPQSRA